jgi:hypothetical protein
MANGPNSQRLSAGVMNRRNRHRASSCAEADRREQHTEAAGAHAEPAFGQHHQQTARGPRGQRGKHLDDGEPRQQLVGARCFSQHRRPSAAGALGRRGPCPESDQQHGGGHEGRGVHGEGDLDAPGGDHGAGDRCDGDLADHRCGPHGAVRGHHIVFADDLRQERAGGRVEHHGADGQAERHRMGHGE